MIVLLVVALSEKDIERNVAFPRIAPAPGYRVHGSVLESYSPGEKIFLQSVAGCWAVSARSRRILNAATLGCTLMRARNPWLGSASWEKRSYIPLIGGRRQARERRLTACEKLFVQAPAAQAHTHTRANNLHGHTQARNRDMFVAGCFTAVQA